MKDIKKVRNISIISACIALIIVAVVLYALFMSNYIFVESASHLHEIYNQVGEAFNQKISDYKNAMFSWEEYIFDKTSNSDNPSEKNELVQFIAQQKANWGFKGFYFINVEDPDSPAGATVKTVSGDVSTLALRRNASVLLDKNDGGVIVRTLNEKGEVIGRSLMFAVQVSDKNKATYEGFDYDAIGIMFDAETLQESLQVQAFNGQGTCFVILPDEAGNVLLQSGDGARIDELMAFLRDDGKFKGDGLERMKAYLKKVLETDNDKLDVFSAETVLFTMNENGTEYYLSYEPVGFSDWILCGLVPSSVLNSNMSTFRTITIFVMASIFTLIMASLTWILITANNRKVREKELDIDARERLLDLLTQDSNDIFVLFNADTYVCEYVSSNVEQVLGLDADALKSDVRLFTQALNQGVNIFSDGKLDVLKFDDDFETDISCKNARTEVEYWFRVIVRQAMYKDKSSYVMMLSDRTNERNMNRNLQDALNIAKAANQAKSNFLANMSHDIRTPMNAIIGFATLLAKDAEHPDKVREYVRKISFSSQHLLSLINDILDMSKIESGKSSLNAVEFNLPELIEELYAMVLPQTKSKKLNFDVKTKGYIPEIVYGDKLRINQILINLLSNAVKYTPDNGSILLQVESVNESSRKNVHLRITVQDNGIGMSKEFVQTIFDPFAREVNEATKEIQGTGLGMTITKQIIDLMGGTISVDSEKGKGSTFVVELELPIVSTEERDDEEFWKKHEIFRVLVVDDEEDICKEVCELMEETGVDVDYSLSGAEALGKISERHNTESEYNIVLLDWKMPEMDGVETARRIRALVGKDVPIMILTSYNVEDIEEEARAAGINLFMSKPFFVSNFRHAVSQLDSACTEASEDKEEKKLYSLKGLKILAAEDNEINAEILCELLDIEGAVCEIAENGQIALEKFQASKEGAYDIIFMDVQMPVMNGYEATKAIRACSHPEAKTIPIVAMTANAFDDDVKKALDSGMNAHLAKPIDMLKLRTVVAKLCGGKND